MPHIRWIFTERPDTRPIWTWTRFHPNGRVELESRKFLTYGGAMHDAISTGNFMPRVESWGVRAASGISSYFNTDPSVPNSSQVISSNPRTEQPAPRAQSPPEQDPKRKRR